MGSHVVSTACFFSMLRRKRGPYRQYMRQDEPLQSRSLLKKLRRSNKECKNVRTLSIATESAGNFDNVVIDQSLVDDSDSESNSFLEVRQESQEIENFDSNLDDNLSNEPCELDWTGTENFEEFGSTDGIDYSSESDISCSSKGTVYDCDSDNSTDGSIYDDCDLEQSNDNNPPLYKGASISLSSSILLILSFVLKHRLTGQCFTDLLAIIEAHCPKPNHCNTSVRGLFAYFKNIKGNLVKHIFCTYCKGYICEETNTEHLVLPNHCGICGII